MVAADEVRTGLTVMDPDMRQESGLEERVPKVEPSSLLKSH